MNHIYLSYFCTEKYIFLSTKNVAKHLQKICNYTQRNVPVILTIHSKVFKILVILCKAYIPGNWKRNFIYIIILAQKMDILANCKCFKIKILKIFLGKCQKSGKSLIRKSMNFREQNIFFALKVHIFFLSISIRKLFANFKVWKAMYLSK